MLWPLIIINIFFNLLFFDISHSNRDELAQILSINFSKVSKACRKLATIKKPFRVTLIIMDSPSIWIENCPITYHIKWTKEKNNYGTRMKRSFLEVSRLIIYSENPLDAMKEFYQYARSLVGVDIDRLLFDMIDFEGQCREIVDWLGLNFSKMQALCVSGSDRRQEELQYVLDNVKVKGNLDICAETIEQVPLRIPEIIQKLCITNGSWITLDYVMSLKMSQLDLRDTHLTNQDLNVFFNSWMQMKSHRNLESFETDLTKHEDFTVVGLRGIPYEMGPRRPELCPDYTAIGGSYEVTRKDGLKSSICVFQYATKFIVIMYTRLSQD